MTTYHFKPGDWVNRTGMDNGEIRRGQVYQIDKVTQSIHNNQLNPLGFKGYTVNLLGFKGTYAANLFEPAPKHEVFKIILANLYGTQTKDN